MRQPSAYHVRRGRVEQHGDHFACRASRRTPPSAEHDHAVTRSSLARSGTRAPMRSAIARQVAQGCAESAGDLLNAARRGQRPPDRSGEAGRLNGPCPAPSGPQNALTRSSPAMLRGDGEVGQSSTATACSRSPRVASEASFEGAHVSCAEPARHEELADRLPAAAARFTNANSV